MDILVYSVDWTGWTKIHTEFGKLVLGGPDWLLSFEKWLDDRLLVIFGTVDSFWIKHI